MKELLIVRGAPEEYVCEIGAWNYLESFLNKRKSQKVLVLHGEESWEVAKKFFPSLEGIALHFFHYNNQCSIENAVYFEKLVDDLKIDCIVAVGGGKVLDLGKLVANNCQKDVICLPTLASTCAAYTPISIIYKESGEMLGMKFLNQSVSAVFIDPNVILNSPTEYLVAGIGDTLAKWYESEPIISLNKNKLVEIDVAQFAAKSCRDNILAHGKKAVIDLENNVLSAELINIIETNILLAGMVGGFGDKYGRSSGAHAIHDALTLIEATHKHLHGNKVAYGILVQLAVEEKWEEIEKLRIFYKELKLPYQLHQLDMEEKDIKLVAQTASTDSLFHQLPQEITEEAIEKAMLFLE